MTDQPEGTVRRKVWFSETLALGLGASLVDWGEPDEAGFYTPALTQPAAPAEAPCFRCNYDRQNHRSDNDHNWEPRPPAPAEGLREAARDLYSALVSEHGHDETHSADWPACLPVHIAMNRYRAALTPEDDR